MTDKSLGSRVLGTNSWDELANYESFELVKRAYEAKHNREMSTRHSREIAAPISHANAYFRSARSADLAVKPLLLYYGVLSLSRGLTLYLSRGLREAALTPSHGLGICDWGSHLSADNPDFASLEVRALKGGSFADLCKATRCRSLLRHNSSGVNYTFSSHETPAGTTLTLGDILSRIPDIQNHHRRWRDYFLGAQIENTTTADGLFSIKIKKGYGTTAITDAKTLCVNSEFVVQHESHDKATLVGPPEASKSPGMTDMIDRRMMNIGDVWLVAAYTGGTNLSKISTLFVLSYILGMLVRYYPAQWTALSRGLINDAALPTLTAAIDLIESAYPETVLDFLREVDAPLNTE